MKITSVEFVRSIVSPQEIIQDNLNQIAFSGRSNVGKSSLINCLLNRKKIAKTSSTPGKTRQLNFFKINNQFYFVDLPGYGFAKVSKKESAQWRNLIEGFFIQNQKLAGVISIIDSRIGPTELDLQLLNWIKSLNITLILVATKSDKLSRSVLKNNLDKYNKQIESLYKTSIIPFSVINRTGKKEIWREIITLLGQD